MEKTFKKGCAPQKPISNVKPFGPGYHDACHIDYCHPLNHHGSHEHLKFMEGRYIDLANVKGKDPNTLYLGTSLSTDKLSGLFLGDTEITSRIKDVSLYTSDTPGINELIVTFINSKNKLQSIKTSFATLTSINNLRDEIKDIIEKTVYPIDSSIIERVIAVDASMSNAYDHLNIIDGSIDIINSSIDDIYDRLDVIDSSYVDLIEQLETGRYNYTIAVETSDFSEGYKKTYSLLKGEEEQSNSEKIEIIDIVPKELNYDAANNKINLISWPKDINEKNLVEIIDYELDGTPITKVTQQLNSDLINTVSLDLDPFVTYIVDFMDTESKLNTRVTIVEKELTWETL